MDQTYDFDKEIAIKLGPINNSAEPKALCLYLGDEGGNFSIHSMLLQQ